MNNGSVTPDANTLFNRAYRMAKRHAEKFGWGQTNADIRFVFNPTAKHTPELAKLGTDQLRELIVKWTLDLDADTQVGFKPPFDYDMLKKAVDEHEKRFNKDATCASLKRLGGSSYAINIKHALRGKVIDGLNAEVEQDRQRARRIAGKSDATQHKPAPRRKYRDQRGEEHLVQGPVTVFNTVETIDAPCVTSQKAAQAISRAITVDRVARASRPARRDQAFTEWKAIPVEEETRREAARRRALRRGPVTGYISSWYTHEDERVGLCYRDRVRLRDNTYGVVTSITAYAIGGIVGRGESHWCATRIVVLMDDLTTRVLEHADVLSYWIVDVMPAGVSKREHVIPGLVQLFAGGMKETY